LAAPKTTTWRMVAGHRPVISGSARFVRDAVAFPVEGRFRAAMQQLMAKYQVDVYLDGALSASLGDAKSSLGDAKSSSPAAIPTPTGLSRAWEPVRAVHLRLVRSLEPATAPTWETHWAVSFSRLDLTWAAFSRLAAPATPEGRVTVAGHDHTTQWLCVDGVSYIVNGVGGYELHALQKPKPPGTLYQNNTFHGFAFHQLTADAMEVTWVDTERRARQTVRVPKFGGCTGLSEQGLDE
jgi:hypothetical protein